MKKILVLSFLIAFIAYRAIAQTIPVDISQDPVFTQYFNVVMSAIIILVGIIAGYIPALKNINKATLTIVTSVIVGAIDIFYFKGNILQVVLSALGAVVAYNQVIRQAVNEPVIKSVETADKAL